MIDDLQTRTLAHAFRKAGWLSKLPKVALGLTVLAMPLLVYATFYDYSDWSSLLLSRAIQGGYFWQDPTGFLFQQTFADGYISSLGDLVEGPFTFLIFLALGLVLVFSLLHFIVGHIQRFVLSRTVSEQTVIFPESLLEKLLTPRFSVSHLPLWEFAYNGRVIRFFTFRQWVILSVDLEHHVPHILLETGSHDRGPRLLPIAVNMRYEAILEAEFLQRFHVYTARELFKYLPQFMTPALMQHFVAQPAALNIELHSTHIHMLFTQSELSQANRLATHLAGLCKVADQIDDRSGQLNQNDLHRQLAWQLPAQRIRSLHVSSMIIRGWWLKVLFAVLLIGLLLESMLMRGGVNLNNAMLQITLLAIMIAFLAYGPVTKSVRQKQRRHQQSAPKSETTI